MHLQDLIIKSWKRGSPSIYSGLFWAFEKGRKILENTAFQSFLMHNLRDIYHCDLISKSFLVDRFENLGGLDGSNCR